MRITTVESFVLKLDTGQAYLGALPDGTTPTSGYAVRPPWRSLYSDRYETMLVALTAEDGTAGWGEALAPVAPEVPATIVDRLLAPVLIGQDATSPRPGYFTLRQLMRERGHLDGHQADALAAVDIALWDLAARLHGVRVVDLLGGAFRTSVPCYVSGLPRPDDEGRAQLAAQRAEQGHRAVKLHLGHGVHTDLATLDAVRRAAPELQVAIDAHWAYDLPAARRLAVAMAERDAWFLEAPLAPEDQASHRELVACSPVPIAVGEALRHRYAFTDWVTQRALTIAQPDVARTGITEASAIADICAAHHMPVAPHHSVGLTVALAAGLHVSAAAENVSVFEYQPTSTDLGNRALHQSLEPSGAAFDLPNGPGLGLNLDINHIRTLAEEL